MKPTEELKTTITPSEEISVEWQQEGAGQSVDLPDSINAELWETFLSGSEVERSDIPDEYSEWQASLRRTWRLNDSKFIYWEWKDDVIWVLLFDYSYYPGGWAGMEYWVKLYLKRWDSKDYVKIVYRDSYSSSRDDWWKAYQSIESIEINWDKVTLKLSSNRRTDQYSFTLKKPEWVAKSEKMLSLEEQSQFSEYVESTIQELLENYTRVDWKYPLCYDLTTRQIPNYFSSRDPYDERPYDKAEVIEKKVDKMHGVAYVVIKTQIGASVDSWKQFAWLKYCITPSETKLVSRETAYQSELMNWKRIEIRAE